MEELNLPSCSLTECSYLNFEQVHRSVSAFPARILRPQQFSRDVLQIRDSVDDVYNGMAIILRENHFGVYDCVIVDLSEKVTEKQIPLGVYSKKCDVIDDVLKKVEAYKREIQDYYQTEVLYLEELSQAETNGGEYILESDYMHSLKGRIESVAGLPMYLILNADIPCCEKKAAERNKLFVFEYDGRRTVREVSEFNSISLGYDSLLKTLNVEDSIEH